MNYLLQALQKEGILVYDILTTKYEVLPLKQNHKYLVLHQLQFVSLKIVRLQSKEKRIYIFPSVTIIFFSELY